MKATVREASFDQAHFIQRPGWTGPAEALVDEAAATVVIALKGRASTAWMARLLDPDAVVVLSVRRKRRKRVAR